MWERKFRAGPFKWNVFSQPMRVTSMNFFCLWWGNYNDFLLVVNAGSNILFLSPIVGHFKWLFFSSKWEVTSSDVFFSPPLGDHFKWIFFATNGGSFQVIIFLPPKGGHFQMIFFPPQSGVILSHICFHHKWAVNSSDFFFPLPMRGHFEWFLFAISGGSFQMVFSHLKGGSLQVIFFWSSRVLFLCFFSL